MTFGAIETDMKAVHKICMYLSVVVRMSAACYIVLHVTNNYCIPYSSM